MGNDAMSFMKVIFSKSQSSKPRSLPIWITTMNIRKILACVKIS
jgi:hypothetical protein